MEEVTSFIPKKTLTRPAYLKRGPSFLVLFSVFLLIISGVALGGAYFYKNRLNQGVDGLTRSLKQTQDILDPNFLQEIKRIDEKIKNAKIILSQHVLITPLFTFLENSTLKNIRFNSLSFHSPAPMKSETVLILTGSAVSFKSLALQIEEFKKNNSVKDINTSGLALGEKGEVNFSMEISFSPSYFRNK